MRKNEGKGDKKDLKKQKKRTKNIKKFAKKNNTVPTKKADKNRGHKRGNKNYT